jgi:lipid II:glycine glycyltransferase (peptidoglycan interpeptide bridge formation enzyme)
MMLWQTPAWEELQRALGVGCVRVEGVLLLIKPLPASRCFVEVQRAAPTAGQWQKIVRYAREQNAVFIRFAPSEVDCALPLLPARQLRQAIFPEATRLVDLSPDEATIRSGMSASGRRHLRLAEKAGVTVRESDDVAAYARLARQTAARDGFRAHQMEYFTIFLQTLRAAGARLLVAEKDGHLLAGGIFLLAPPTAVYYYGASDDRQREANAPMLLQWRAMQIAKQNGCGLYDLLGVAADENDPSDPLHGVSRFKQKFGGLIVRYHPQSDFIIRPFWYEGFAWLKKIRRIWRR